MEESPLDEVAAACSSLATALKGAKTQADMDELLTKHIDTVWASSSPIEDFNKNLEWVNVSSRLSLAEQCSERVVVLDFFTYCCVNCLHVLPDLRALEERHPPVSGLVVIGVHSAKFENEKETENIVSCVRRLDIRHAVVNDPESVTWRKLGVRCWPTLLVLGPELKPLFVLTGEGHREALLLYVGAALQHFAPRLQRRELPLAPASHVAARPADKLRYPGKLALNPFYRGEANEPFLAISDTGNHRIVVTDYTGQIVRTVGGLDPGFKDGKSWEALFNSPQGLCWLSGSVLVVCDTGNHALRSVDLDENSVELLCGTGQRAPPQETGGECLTLQPLSSPWDVVLYSTADMDLSVRSPLLAGPKPPPPPGDAAPSAPPAPPAAPAAAAERRESKGAADKKGELRRVLLVACAGSHQIWALFLDTTIWWKYKKYEEGSCVCVAGNGVEAARNSSYPMTASFAQPSGLALKLGGGPELLIADSESSSVRRLSLSSGQVTALAGGDRNPMNLFAFGNKDGVGFDAKFQHPLGVAYCEQSRCLYVADTFNHSVRRVELSTQRVVTLRPARADADDAPAHARLREPAALAVTADAKYVYIADTDNHSVKILNVAKNVCQEFAVRLRSVEGEDPKSTIAYNRDLFINKNCGTIVLMFSISLDTEKNDVQLMSGAPQHYSVRIEDDKGEDVAGLFELVNCSLQGSKLPARLQLRLKRRTALNVIRMHCTFKTSLCGNKCFFYTFKVCTQILVRESVKPVESFRIGFRFNPHEISKPR